MYLLGYLETSFDLPINITLDEWVRSKVESILPVKHASQGKRVLIENQLGEKENMTTARHTYQHITYLYMLVFPCVAVQGLMHGILFSLPMLQLVFAVYKGGVSLLMIWPKPAVT